MDINQDAPISATTKKPRQRKTLAQVLADIDAQQAQVDDARATARKAMDKRATHIKILLGGLLFAVAPREEEPWHLARRLMVIAESHGIKTARASRELEAWIADQAEIDAMRARGRRRT